MGALSKIHNEEEKEDDDDDDKDDQKVNELIIPNSCISKEALWIAIVKLCKKRKAKGGQSKRGKYLNSTLGRRRANASQKRLTDSKAKARDHVYLGVGGEAKKRILVKSWNKSWKNISRLKYAEESFQLFLY